MTPSEESSVRQLMFSQVASEAWLCGGTPHRLCPPIYPSSCTRACLSMWKNLLFECYVADHLLTAECTCTVAHRVERTWVWDPKTHTRIPRYPSNSLTCGPLKYQRTKLIWCYYAQVWLFMRICCCSHVCVVAYNMLLLNSLLYVVSDYFFLKLMCCKCGYFYPRVPIYPGG
jgi:hypothetical protein